MGDLAEESMERIAAAASVVLVVPQPLRSSKQRQLVEDPLAPVLDGRAVEISRVF